MKPSKLGKAALVVAVGSMAILPTATFAQESRWYVGGSLGQSKVNVDTGELDRELTGLGIGHSGFRADEKDTAWKIFAGYKFNRNFALEGGWHSLGEWSASTTITSVFGTPVTPVGSKAEFKTQQVFDIAAVGILPVSNEFSVFGKLGLYTAKTEVRFSIGTISDSANARNENLLLGLGLGYDFSKNVGARLEWEHFRQVGDKDKTFEGDVNVFTLGIVYSF
jgi:OOP family OmpA-OmpF porin